MIFLLFGITFSISQLLNDVCPSAPTNSIDLSTSDAVTNKRLYGCNLKDKRIYASKSLVYLYYCTFSKITDSSSDGGGAIYIYTTSNKCPTGNCTIEHCTFYGCQATKGGAISIYTAQIKRYFTIIECNFTNNRATNNGGAINFEASFATVELCIFKNNYASGNGCEVYYLCKETENPERPNPFLLSFNKFEQNNNEQISSMIYLDWKEQSDFIFEQNEIKIDTTNDFYIFGFSGTYNPNADQTLQFTSNCISPSKEKLFESQSSNVYQVINNGFSTCDSNQPVITNDPTITKDPIITNEPTITKDPVITIEPIEGNCPKAPTSSIDLSTSDAVTNKKLYGCNLKDKRIYASKSLVYLYYCTFSKITDSSSDGGGAIYIYTTSNKCPTGNCTIEHCTFYGCQATKGGAISIKTAQKKRFISIHNCKFQNNKAENEGGAILFLAVFATVNQCEFIDNNAGTFGSEVYFDCIEDPNTEWDNPFLIQFSTFEKTNENSQNALIYLKWNEHSDFIFNNNKVKLTKQSQNYLFDSTGDVSIGTLTAKDNCIGPSQELICDSSNKALLDRIQNGFPCLIIIPDLYEFNSTNCEALKHCEKETSNDQYVHVTIDISSFNSFHHDKDGGAIRLINCGFSAKDANFKSCYSENGGGGGIFIFNQHDHSYEISIKNIVFDSCKSFYGGAIYIYSIAEQSPVTIIACKFIRNDIYDPDENHNKKDQLFGGSALYLTVKNGNVDDCIFNSKGTYGIIKANERFDVKPDTAKMLNMNDNQINSISINGCTFVTEKDSDSSLFYVFANHNNKMNIQNCSFSGYLAKNSHHIDGISLVNEKPNILIKSCNFSTSKKNAINTKFVKADLVLNKFVNNNWSILLQVALIALAIVVIVIAVLFKKSNNSTKDENESSDKESPVDVLLI